MKAKLTILASVITLLAWGQDEIMIDGAPCGMTGSARANTKEYKQNPLKNRYLFPVEADFDRTVTMEKLTGGSAVKGKYSEGKAVEVTAYVFDVKKTGRETCNCKTSDPAFQDTHIELTLNDAETGKEKRVVAEVTPRIRQKLLAQGIDWSTEKLRQELKGHMVKFQGWLFYDGSHETENFADDPDDTKGKANWRATCWEIHPVTSIELLDEDTPDVLPAGPETGGTMDIAPVPAPEETNSVTTIKTTVTMESTPMNTLILILLGAILGMVGQGMRVIVGLKKVGDEAVRTGQKQKDLIVTKQLVLSLFVAFAVGSVAGVLAALGSTDLSITKTTLFAFLAAGYAGTDFIEGFIKKNAPGG